MTAIDPGHRRDGCGSADHQQTKRRARQKNPYEPKLFHPERLSVSGFTGKTETSSRQAEAKYKSVAGLVPQRAYASEFYTLFIRTLLPEYSRAIRFVSPPQSQPIRTA